METVREAVREAVLATAHGRARPAGRPGDGRAGVAWEPTKPVEFVVPAGTGGGADQMARLIAGLAEKHKLSPKPFIVVNKSGGAGAEGFLYVKGKKGDAQTIVITLSNLFTTPLHTGVPFNWKDLTPVARLALDEFILWVNAETPYKTAKEYCGGEREEWGMRWVAPGGAGDQIRPSSSSMRWSEVHYVPFKGAARCASISWASTCTRPSTTHRVV